MIRHARKATGFCLAVVLTCTMILESIRADDRNHIRLGASATFGPIGRVYSLNKIAIDGRLVSGEREIWGGELLAVLDATEALVSLDSIGEVRLGRGTTVRLTARSVDLVGIDRRLLVASLTKGDLWIKLEGDARAYIESCGSAFTSTIGASFRFGVRKDEAVFDPANALVRIENQITRRIYTFRRVNPKYDPSRPSKPKSNDINKHPGETEKITLFVQYIDKTTTNQQILFQPGGGPADVQSTNEKPASTTRILFKLTKDIGELSPVGGPIHTGARTITATTDDKGLATVIFTAGANPDKADLMATVEDLRHDEDEIPWTGHIAIEKAGFLRRHRRNLSIAAAAAATIVIVIHRHKGPIQQQPPPVIIP